MSPTPRRQPMVQCPHCGAMNDPARGSRYCFSCGLPLDGSGGSGLAPAVSPFDAIRHTDHRGARKKGRGREGGEEVSYALRMFSNRAMTPPFVHAGTRVYPAKAKVDYGVCANGAVVHRVASLAVTYVDNKARFGARWKCGGGSDNVLLLEMAGADDLCSACVTAKQPVVYRCYDADGALLYIGCTENLKQRITGHKSKSPWWQSVADMKVERCASMFEARRYERAAIRREHPRFNRVHRARRGA